MGSIFKKLSGVVVNDSSKYFKDGTYIVEIKAVSEAGRDKDHFCIECEVLATKSEDDDAPAAGQTAAEVWKQNDKWGMGVQRWVGFVCAVLDISPTDLTDDEWEEMSEKVLEGEFKGYRMKLECFTIMTKQDKPFTKHKWHRQVTESDLREFDL